MTASRPLFQPPGLNCATAKTWRQWALGLGLALASSAWADIHVGVVLSLTGPGA
jgi:hypothetical protein